ncbi:MAG: superoxide dismutase [Bacteroidales bacterium]
MEKNRQILLLVLYRNLLSVLIGGLILAVPAEANGQKQVTPILGSPVILNDQNKPITINEMPKIIEAEKIGFAVFDLPKLSYQLNELEPIISGTAMMYHYGKHTLAYVNKVNDLLVGSKFQKASLEEMIRSAEGALFNNAAQLWNHTFYFYSLNAPKDSNLPSSNILSAIEKQWGSFDNFKAEFNQKANSLFGSGWVWLVKDKNRKLSIVQTMNADNPMRMGLAPLLVLDVWEHAYYTDYLNAWWALVDWDQIEARLKK